MGSAEEVEPLSKASGPIRKCDHLNADRKNHCTEWEAVHVNFSAIASVPPRCMVMQVLSRSKVTPILSIVVALAVLVTISVTKTHTIERLASSHELIAPTIAQPPILPKLTTQLEYASAPIRVTQVDEIGSYNSYSIQRVRLPAVEGFEGLESDLLLDYFTPRKASRLPVIIILPMMHERAYAIERFFARFFSERDMAVVIIQGEYKIKGSQSLVQLNNEMRKSLIRIRQALDWIETQPELDRDRIGLLGLSFGAVRGAIISAVDPRIKGSVLALVGGDFSHLIMDSAEPALKRFREERIKLEHLSAEQFRANIREIMTYDPILYARYVDPRRVMIVLAAFDTSIPYSTGVALRARMGNPETITVMAGHYSAIAFVPYIRHEAFEFLSRQLR